MKPTLLSIPFSRIYLGMIVLVFGVYGCYSPQDGCIDPEATNYAISADNMCDECCTYPDLKLSIFHENKDTTFKLQDTIVNDLGQEIVLLDFVYLLSDFVIEMDNELHEVSDSIGLDVVDGVEYVKDDVIRVSRDQFTYELGTIIFDGNTTQLSFKAGLSDILNENPFTTEIEGHPLTSDPDSLYNEEKGTYVFQRLKVAQGEGFLDTVVYDINTSVQTSFTFDYESLRGNDKTLTLEAQYDRWFDGIDFLSLSKNEIENALTLNTVNVFRQKN